MTARKAGFTIVELLIVIVVIGVLAAIVIVAYTGIQAQARSAAISADLRNVKQAISRLEIDTGASVFGCPTRTFGPEGSITGTGAGLTGAPITGTVNEGCTWSTGAVTAWKGPYMPTTVDPWGRPYRIDLDYFICENGSARLIAAALSLGEDGSLQYPASTTSGACTTTSSDDKYVELWR